jgi:DNA-binding CsgD family transcriptional regulator
MDKDVLERWIEDGRSLEWIGRQVGRHPSTVAYWVAKHGLQAPGREKHAARGPLDRAVLEALVARGLSIREIATEVDRSYQTVRHWLRHHGLQTARGRKRELEPTSDDRRRTGVCPRHGEAVFGLRSDGAWRCLRCRSEAVADRRRRLKQIVVAEAGGCCAVCGYDRSAAALQFHHVDPATKRFEVAARGITRSLERLREEVRKCVLLCANCHAEVEAGVAKLPGVAADHHW